MGGYSSKEAADIAAKLMDEFVMAHCEIDVASSCNLDELSIAFALFILKNHGIRRKLCCLFDEPDLLREQQDKKWILQPVYNFRKWHYIAEKALRSKLAHVHFLSVGSNTVVLGIRIKRLPENVIARSQGSHIILQDRGDATVDYIMKPFRAWF